MNLLVTGSNGQLGQEIKKISNDFPSYKLFLCDFDQLNICDENAVSSYFKINDINCVINCAAYTNVDEAESNSESANNVNNIGVSNLVDASYDKVTPAFSSALIIASVLAALLTLNKFEQTFKAPVPVSFINESEPS